MRINERLGVDRVKRKIGVQFCVYSGGTSTGVGSRTPESVCRMIGGADIDTGVAEGSKL